MDIIRQLNWIDVLVIILVIRISYVAFQEGLSHEIFPLISGIASIIISLRYYHKLGGFFSNAVPALSKAISNFTGFCLLVIGTGLVFKLVRIVLDRVIKVQWHPLIERFGGLVFGACRGAITACLVLETMAMAPLPYLQWSIRDRSFSGVYFVRIGPTVYEAASGFLPFIKADGLPADKEAIINDLLSDKTIAQSKETREKNKNRSRQ